MALVLIEGFEAYDVTNGNNIDTSLNRKWQFAVDNFLAAGRTFGHSSNIQVGGELRSVIFASQATWTVGFGWKHVGNNGVILTFLDGATDQVDMQLNGSNQLEVTRNGTLLGTGTTTLLNSAWYYLEMKATIDPAAGAITVRINGVNEIVLSGINTQFTANPSANNFAFSGFSGTSSFFDDIYICDTTGATNTTFLGDLVVESILPTAPGFYTQWTPLSPPNWSEVNEIPPDDDTSYVFTNTVSNKDSYTFASLAHVVSDIRGIQINVLNRKDAAGSRVIAPLTRVAATDYVGPNYSVLDNYSYDTQVIELNPNTSVLWTVTDVNTAQFGQEMIS